MIGEPAAVTVVVTVAQPMLLARRAYPTQNEMKRALSYADDRLHEALRPWFAQSKRLAFRRFGPLVSRRYFGAGEKGQGRGCNRARASRMEKVEHLRLHSQGWPLALRRADGEDEDDERHDGERDGLGLAFRIRRSSRRRLCRRCRRRRSRGCPSIGCLAALGEA